ncbi:hypothetical protein HOF65_05715 [bacterium]|nr:hypothetical protein [bacterium]MBT3853436.1 hypothetical protein [bacterium]MBT4633226.1 hypothetical protein [bacterium]MBT6778957.1 hypothetical protein [bacterium]
MFVRDISSIFETCSSHSKYVSNDILSHSKIIVHVPVVDNIVSSVQSNSKHLIVST